MVVRELGELTLNQQQSLLALRQLGAQRAEDFC